MKKDIHPKYFANAKVTCACGSVFVVGSTQEKIDVEICSQCHPFYTGTDKVLDSAGRVEKFKTRVAAARPVKNKKEAKAAKRATRTSLSAPAKKSTKK